MHKSRMLAEIGSVDPRMVMKAETLKRFVNLSLVHSSRDVGTIGISDVFHSMDISADNQMLLTASASLEFTIISTKEDKIGIPTLKNVGGGNVESVDNPAISAFPGLRCRWHPADSKMFTTSGGQTTLQIWDASYLDEPVEKCSHTQNSYYKHNMNPIRPSLIAASPSIGCSLFNIIDLRIGVNKPALFVSHQQQKSMMIHGKPVEELIWNPAICERIATAFVNAGKGMERNTLEIVEWDIRSPAWPLFPYEVTQFYNDGEVIITNCSLKYSCDGLHLYSYKNSELSKYSTEEGKFLNSIYIKDFHDAVPKLTIREFALTNDCAFIPHKRMLATVDLSSFSVVRDTITPRSLSTNIVVVDEDRQIVFGASHGVQIYASTSSEVPKLPKKHKLIEFDDL